MIVNGGDKKASHDRGTTLSFPEIVGQEAFKRALLSVAANDDLSGLLVQGEKGTAKSTAVRALTDLLPEQDVVEDCPYGCPPDVPDRQCEDCRERNDPPTTRRSVPLVTLPLGATRERVVGTLSVADALDGDHEFDPGLLARANRGILYVDEVNLLDDHLVDVLLDAAASGVNRVERDGVSVSHPSTFTLVGTMNPEEGDLRPQLRDRFALTATVTSCDDVDDRVRIIDRALGQAARDTTDGSDGARAAVSDLRDQVHRARSRLSTVELPARFAREIAELCRDSGVDGHRGDIATARAARTFAALDGRSTVVEPDVRRAAELALPHRLRSRPFEDAPDPGDLVADHFDDTEDERDRDDGNGGRDGDRSETGADPSDEADHSGDVEDTNVSGGSGDVEETTTSEGGHDPSAEDAGSDGAGTDTSHSGRGEETGTGDGRAEATGEDRDADDRTDTTEATPVVPGQSRTDVGTGRAPDLPVSEAVESEQTGGGTRLQTQPRAENDGARVRSRRATSDRRIDAAASVRAATARGASAVESRDLRQSVRRGDASALVLFAVDASASMLPAMRAAKGVLLELLKDAYQQRDEVAFVAFAGDDANVLLPPTDSVSLAARHLKDLPTGDRTPLPAGLRTAADVLDRADPTAGVVVLVTDGRANVADGSPVRATREAAGRLADSGAHVVVVDAGDSDSTGLTGLVADETGGERVPLSALSARRVDAAVDAAREI